MKCQYTDSSKVRVRTGSFYTRGGPQYKVGWCVLGEKGRVHVRSFRGIVGLQRRGLEGWVEETPRSYFKVLLRLITGIALIKLFEYVNHPQHKLLPSIYTCHPSLLNAERPYVLNYPSLSHQWAPVHLVVGVTQAIG